LLLEIVTDYNMSRIKLASRQPSPLVGTGDFFSINVTGFSSLFSLAARTPSRLLMQNVFSLNHTFQMRCYFCCALTVGEQEGYVNAIKVITATSKTLFGSGSAEGKETRQ